MGKPAIVTVDDDPQVLAAITRDLSERYGADYRVVACSSGAEALDVVGRLVLRGDPVEASDLRVVAHRWSEASHEIKTFLARNHVPYRWLDVERDDEGVRLVELSRAATTDLPLVLVPDSPALKAPTTLALADALGL